MYLSEEQVEALKTLINYNTGADEFTSIEKVEQLKKALLTLEEAVTNK